MKKITCEICGSNDIIKKDNFFECQLCGTKYSTEEVKKIVLEGSIDISGSTVKIDNSNNIRNYLNIAQNAYKAENMIECEKYCNMILEIDSKNYEAWFLKGKTAIFQSSVVELVIEKVVNCFSNAIDNTPEDKIDEVKSEIAEELKLIIKTIISYKCQQFLIPPDNEQQFLEYPSDSYKRLIVEAEGLIITKFEELLLRCGVNDSELRYDLYSALYIYAMTKWLDEIEPEYSNIQGYPTWIEWQLFFARADAVVYLLENAIALLKEKIPDLTLAYQCLTNIYETVLEEEARIEKATDRCLLSHKTRHQRFDKVMEWHKKWNEIDSTHIIPKNE